MLGLRWVLCESGDLQQRQKARAEQLYVRLRNSSRGKATGDYHVTRDPRALGEGRVEGVTLVFEPHENLEAS